MASQFGSFNRSPLGAFVKSPLGARGGKIKGQWFLTMAGANEWVSQNGISWSQQASVVPLQGFVGARGFLAGSYSDSPYTLATSFTGLSGQINTVPIRAFSKYWAVSTTAEDLYYSSDSGATWTLASLPATDGSLSYSNVAGNVCKSSSGRLFVPVAYGTGPSYNGYIAYTDDGTNWYLSSLLGFSGAFAKFNVYQQTDDTVYALLRSTSGRYASTDDGETFGTVVAATAPSDLYATVTVMPSGRVIIFIPNTAGYSYTDNNFTTRTTVSTYNIMFDELNLLYSYRTDTDLLYSSTDGSTWSAVSTSPSTLANGSGRPVRVGMTV